MVMWSKEDGSYLNEMEFDSELRNACYNGNEVCIIGKIKQRDNKKVCILLCTAGNVYQTFGYLFN